MNPPTTIEVAFRHDGQLLKDFLETMGDAPFEELVRRHGAMVLGVCLRATRNPKDAEDAAQAAFLTLVEKAGSLVSRSSIGGWLHHVARHISLRLRESEVLRKTLEMKAQEMTNETLPENDRSLEMRELIDAELDTMPEKYRLPMILHYFEERSFEETGRILGLSPGAVTMRVDRGREKLRQKLVRRGVTVSASALGAILSENTSASVGISNMFHASVVKASVAFASGKIVAANIVSSQVVMLAKVMTKALFLENLKFAGAASAIALGVMAGTGVTVHQAVSSDLWTASTDQTTGQPKSTRSPVQYASSNPQTATSRSSAIKASSLSKQASKRPKGASRAMEASQNSLLPSSSAAEDQTGADKALAKKRIVEKLQSIIIESLGFDNIPIQDAIAVLQEKGSAADPTGEGVPISLAASRSETYQITFTLELRRVTLLKAIEFISSTARVKWLVTEQGVLFMDGEVQPPLETRRFPVKDGIFRLTTEVASEDQDQVDIKKGFEQFGFVFPQGTSAYYVKSTKEVVATHSL